MNYDEILVYLNAKGISNSEILIIDEFFSDNNLTADDLKDITNNIELKSLVQKATFQKLKDYDEDLLKKLYEYNDKHGIKVITYNDDMYPVSLKLIENSPAVLYYMGSFNEETIKIAIVGARNHTEYGAYVTEKFASDLCELGVEIVSGMAYGIDSIAHKTALKYGARTTCVLGTGVDICYPSKNRKIYEEVREKGLIVSEFPPTSGPMPYRFPLRNRIISGLSDGVIVVEAKDRSGSLITARVGAEQGKEVFAVPGNINSVYSEGTNKLIRDGAIIALEVGDIVENIYKLQEACLDKKNKKMRTELGEDELIVYDLIVKGKNDVDSIVANTNFSVSQVSGILTVLEIKGVIMEESMGRFMSK
ncbi:DNA-processing protein DprA [Peptoniphilus duerdenii]|uniref:DNA-processing protein DprA n=1 Tax=Peptoniphilus duerdenii TaxID=507750 RepID=UPI002889BAD4|nr:DNA-processing protein DprA [Peptoniphilus duerdenii]